MLQRLAASVFALTLTGCTGHESSISLASKEQGKLLQTAYNPMLSDEEAVWRGVGIQPGGASWPIGLRLGGKIVSISYTSLRCSGNWYKLAESPSHAIDREILKSHDGKGRCKESGFVELSLQKSGRIVALWSNELTDKKKRSVAVLERGRMDDTNPDKVIRLTKNEIKYDTEKPVAFRAPQPVENTMLASAETALAKQQTEMTAKLQKPQMSGDVAVAHLLGGLIGAVYGDAFRSAGSGAATTSSPPPQSSAPITQKAEAPKGVTSIRQDGNFTVIKCANSKEYKVHHDPYGKCGLPGTPGSYECGWAIEDTKKYCQ